MMENYQVVLCALAPRDVRMIEMILARSPLFGMTFQAVTQHDTAGSSPVAVVDAGMPESVKEAHALASRVPRLPLVYLTDTPSANPRPYSIERRRIWSQLLPTLERVVNSQTLLRTRN